jgi:hypothetical protein
MMNFLNEALVWNKLCESMTHYKGIYFTYIFDSYFNLYKVSNISKIVEDQNKFIFILEDRL